jgi:hypothetical protein
MSITLAILSWKARQTLEYTLNSYDLWGLTDLVDQKLIWFNEISDADRDLAEKYGYTYDGSPENLGIAGGYKELVARATGSLFLFLENDWVLIEEAANQIREGTLLLETGVVDVVRYRHRKNPGSPLWSKQFAGNEASKPQYLLESLHWHPSPESIVYGHNWTPLSKLSFGWYMTQAMFANWTNNPTMFRTPFIRRLSEGFTGDVEIDFQEKWLGSHSWVAQGDGLFTHYRID